MIAALTVTVIRPTLAVVILSLTKPRA